MYWKCIEDAFKKKYGFEQQMYRKCIENALKMQLKIY